MEKYENTGAVLISAVFWTLEHVDYRMVLSSKAF